MGAEPVSPSASTEAKSWKIHIAAFFHATTIPGLLALHFYRHPERLQHPSWAGLALLALIYIVLLRQIVLPHLFGPFLHLPTPSTVSWFTGHGKITYPRMPGPALLNIVMSVPNDGLIHLRGFFFLASRLIVTSPDTLTEVLSTRAYDYQKPSPARKFLRRVLGDGLVVVEGAQHKVQRRSVGPAFQPKHIKELIPLFWDKSVELTDVLAEQLGAGEKGKAAGELEINHWASRVTLDIIGVAGAGRNFNTLKNSDDELAKTYESILDPNKGNLLLYFLVNLIFPQWIIRALPWGANTRVASAAHNLRTICRRMLAEKKQLMEKEAEGGKQVDILAVLMRSGNFTDDELTDQLLTFLAAGHETTSSAVTWVMYLLATHPEIQTRLRKEIQSFIPTRNTEVTSSLIDEMPYLHAVCAETLRFYPTVPITVRVAKNQTSIQNVAVPKGTQVIISPWAINRNPKLWGPDAGEFNPDRWLGTDKQPTFGSAGSAYSLLTFLHGPRQCVGHGFAKNELKCLVAALIGRFSVEMADPNEEIEPVGVVTIKPKHGLRLKMQEI